MRFSIVRTILVKELRETLRDRRTLLLTVGLPVLLYPLAILAFTRIAESGEDAIEALVEAAREAWGLATMCGVAGKGETLSVIPRFLITGRRIAGSSFGGCKGREDVPAYVQRYLVGEIDVDSFVSHKLTLDEVNRGFELMEAQDGIRSVIEFS